MKTAKQWLKWQKTSKIYRQRQLQKRNFTFLSIIILLLSIFALGKNQPQFSSLARLSSLDDLVDLVKLQVNVLKSITEHLVTEVDESIIVIGDDEGVINGDFTHIDKLGRTIQYHGSSVDELAEILNQYANTEVEKARLIYSWITHNIAYDVNALKTLFKEETYPDIATHHILTHRATICSGYAHLYQQLAEKMGLESLIILGYAKGIVYVADDYDNVNHAWNGVKIEGKWYLLDATWGAGRLENARFKPEFNPYYFAVQPDELIYSHFPENSRWQLLTQGYTRSKFDNLVTVSDNLFNQNIELVSHKQKKIDAEGKIKITLKAPKNMVAIAKLHSPEKTLVDSYTFVQKDGEYINIYASFPKQGDYILDIFAQPKNQDNFYPLVASYQISASDKGAKFPLTYKHFSDHNGYIESPLRQEISSQSNSLFRIKIDNATQVKVFNKATNNWTDLVRSGNFYTGKVNTDQGKIVVFAKFPQDSRYWALLEYN